MAVAAITVVQEPATIETDGTGSTITKGLSGMTGTLVNAGTVTVWINTLGASVVTTNAQAQSVVPLPVSASMPIHKHNMLISHKTAASAGVLAWFPDKDETN